jgi:RNA polymerase sigma-70 factor, ECF subfamily
MSLVPDMRSFQNEVVDNWDAAFAVALRILVNRECARDAAQEATCLALRYEHRFDSDRAVRPWLLTIARNVALSEARRRTHFNTVADVPEHGETDAGLERFEARETCVAALREFPKLRPAYRRALTMKCRGYQYREIALALSIPVGTAQTHVHRAQRELRKACSL